MNKKRLKINAKNTESWHKKDKPWNDIGDQNSRLILVCNVKEKNGPL